MRDLRAQVEVAALDLLDGLQQLGRGRALEQVAADAGLERAEDVLLVGVHGEDDHLRLREEAAELTRRLDAVQERHRDVHDDDVREGAAGLLDRLLAVLGGADDGDPLMRLEQGENAFADDRVIVGQQHLGSLALHRSASAGPRSFGAADRTIGTCGVPWGATSFFPYP